MKKIIVLIFLCLPLVASEEGNIFVRANSLYEEGQYEKASILYESLIRDGIKDADVFYNLANAYYRQNIIGKAILNYERALMVNPNDEETKENLEFTRSLITDKIEKPEISPLQTIFFFYYYYFSVNTLAILFLVLFSIFSGSLCLNILLSSEKLKSVFSTIAISSLFFLIIITSALSLKYHNKYVVSHAIITSEKAAAFSGTGENYEVLFTIHEGTKITIEEKREGWLKASLANGLTGWLKASNAEKI